LKVLWHVWHLGLFMPGIPRPLGKMPEILAKSAKKCQELEFIKNHCQSFEAKL